MNHLFLVGEVLSILETLGAVARVADQTQADAPHLGTVAIVLDDGGLYYDYRPDNFDLMQWVRLLERPLGRSELDHKILEGCLRDNASIPAGLKGVDEAMLQDLGFSVKEIIRVLVLLLRLCMDKQSQYLALEGTAADWGPGVSMAAVEYLTFSRDYLSLGDLRPGDTRHQRRRIWTSPLMEQGGRYYVFRDILFEALFRWIRYLTRGDWPVPRNYLREGAPNLHRELEERSRALGFVFEDYVNSLLDETRLPYAQFKDKARVGKVVLSREIDSIVVVPHHRRIYVLEYKNISSDQNSKSLQAELKKFLGEYHEKLSRSVREVEMDRLAFVRRVFDLHGKSAGSSAGAFFDGVEEEWSVHAAFVFSSHSPIECLTKPQFFVGINADRISELFGKDSVC